MKQSFQNPATLMSVFRAPHWLSHEEGVSYITKDWTSLCGGERSNNSSTRVSVGSMQVIPNPANDNVQFIFPDNTFTGRWKIDDVTGRTVQEGRVSDSTLSINTSDWKSGVYFFTCFADNGLISAVKFAIAH